MDWYILVYIDWYRLVHIATKFTTSIEKQYQYVCRSQRPLYLLFNNLDRVGLLGYRFLDTTTAICINVFIINISFDEHITEQIIQ